MGHEQGSAGSFRSGSVWMERSQNDYQSGPIYISLYPFISLYISLHKFLSVYIRVYQFMSVYASVCQVISVKNVIRP